MTIREQVRKKKKQQIYIFPIIVLVLIAGFAVLGGTSVIVQEKLLLHNDYLFYEQGTVTGYIFIVLIIIGTVVTIANILAKTQVGTVLEGYAKIWEAFGKWKIAVIFAWIIAIFVCAVDITAVKENEIVKYDIFNLKGKSYSYADVKTAEAGFDRHGEFFYKIDLGDDKITFTTTAANGNIERYYDDTYLELEEFDKALMDLGVKKEASTKYIEKFELGKRYKDRCLRIIGNDLVK